MCTGVSRNHEPGLSDDRPFTYHEHPIRRDVPAWSRTYRRLPATLLRIVMLSCTILLTISLFNMSSTSRDRMRTHCRLGLEKYLTNSCISHSSSMTSSSSDARHHTDQAPAHGDGHENRSIGGDEQNHGVIVLEHIVNCPGHGNWIIRSIISRLTTSCSLLSGLPKETSEASGQSFPDSQPVAPSSLD
jgi:hypothetical protein